MNRPGGVGRFTLRVLRRRQLPCAKRFYQRSLDAEFLASPVATSSVSGGSSKWMDVLGRFLHGELTLGTGRPVAPRFLQPLMSGEEVLNFSSENDDFRRQLGRQLQELREALQGNQKNQKNPKNQPTSESEKAKKSRRGESEESEGSQESEVRRSPARKTQSKVEKKKSWRPVRGESEESEESERWPQARKIPGKMDPQKSWRPVRGESEASKESEESEQLPHGLSRNPKAAKASEPKKPDPKKADPKKADPKKAEPKKADPKKNEPKRLDKMLDNVIRSESEESEESELRPKAKNYQVSESEETLKSSKKSSRTVKAESEESEKVRESEESEESEKHPRNRDPNLIEGTYWTGEGKRLEVKGPKDEGKKENTGYISGDGRESEVVRESEKKPSDVPRGQGKQDNLKDE
ncbi:hypothetical protein KR054_007859 [Drosophila jambulina]|nr:hypothetical protein KR054_007859 [Drosophila jambulina]